MKDSRAKAPGPHRWLEAGLLALISAGLLLKLHLVFLLNLNWDEYHYLSYVYEHAQGILTNPWQTFHVHLFSWLVDLPGYEISQLFAARLVLWGLAVAATALVYALARPLLSRPASLFAALSYLSFAYLVEHGASFRPDTLSAPFFLAALYLLAHRRSALAALAAGLLLALAVMITIKSVLFVGLAGLVLLLRLGEDGEKGRFLRRAVACATGFLVAAGTFWLWHRSGLLPAELASTNRYLKSSASKVFLSHGFFPGWPYFAHSLRRDALSWLLLFGGGLVAARQALRGPRPERVRGLLLLSFSLPLLTLLVYRNSFPYFYVFVLSTSVLLCGVSLDFLLGALKARAAWVPRLLVTVLIVALGGQMAAHYLRQAHDQNGQQKVLLATVHRMFPQPVPYIDRCSMVASFPKRGFFMSSWGMETYRAAGEAVLSKAVRSDHPLFVIANVPSLWFFLSDEQLLPERLSLLEEDRDTLRDHYVQHWGWLFVAGKRLQLASGEPSEFEVLIPGPYTLEGAAAVVIDGQTLAPGSVLELSPGWHTAAAEAGVEEAVLRWGDHIFRPARQPPVQNLFRDF
jgi:hypothetical protein